MYNTKHANFQYGGNFKFSNFFTIVPYKNHYFWPKNGSMNDFLAKLVPPYGGKFESCTQGSCLVTNFGATPPEGHNTPTKICPNSSKNGIECSYAYFVNSSPTNHNRAIHICIISQNCARPNLRTPLDRKFGPRPIKQSWQNSCQFYCLYISKFSIYLKMNDMSLVPDIKCWP